MISVVIPTLNEEKYLPKLLESLKNQTYKDFEIIVSDADSKDHTRNIARKYGAQIAQGGPISMGRNSGASLARYNLLLFMDADVIADPNLIETCIKTYKEKRMDVGSVYFHKNTDNIVTDFAYRLWDTSKALRQYSRRPDATGAGIFVTKEAFNAVNGYDENRRLGTDSDLVGRLAAKGFRFRMINAKVTVSTRRYKRSGAPRVMLTNAIAGLVHRRHERLQRFLVKLYGGWNEYNEGKRKN